MLPSGLPWIVCRAALFSGRFRPYGTRLTWVLGLWSSCVVLGALSSLRDTLDLGAGIVERVFGRQTV
ncbi:hypothetical protein [Paenibacillus agricola]|uniref:Uncharacterized protein n=1 Tax=Paenibacillus agricola TaxID=2716264 RepID=A0ABX0J3A8_9BACL|nr:hypothetical protein [Paenibacillus agricola]NHN28464.1 hypothetical protein [Paenibacillus agricola]